MADRTSEAFSWSEGWIPVSTKLIAARRLTLGLVYLLVIAGVVALFVISDVPRVVAWAGVVVALVLFVWAWWLIGRRVRSFGYAERGDDLLVTSGIMFRRLVIVPYGRMQLVDVKAGPIDRWMGITTVQLHTAAATTDASIPGLEPAVAADLRDRLARRGEQRTTGL
jgi:membrane protein YdbS with pleckstrin-like domain